MLDAVVDTNVFVSGLLTQGNARQIIKAFRMKRFNLVLSDVLFAEISDVFKRPKFSLMLDNEEVANLLIIFRNSSTWVTPSRPVTICRDSEDNALLEASLSAKADFLVTGDADLLTLRSFETTRIISVKEFLNILRKVR